MRSICSLCLILFAGGLSAEGLIAPGPNADAPEQIQQFGQLQGRWHCTSQTLQAEGEWRDDPGHAEWTFHYILDGYAIQDVWRPSAESGSPVGTNLRTYDTENDTWHMVWTTTSNARFDYFSANYHDGEIAMSGERRATAAYPAHLALITFHNISEQHFDWKYESAAVNTTDWREVLRIACDRVETD